ncbi:hypothetical protein BJ508DRAFT_10821 [Ascobolus immersus RN42]|uniref:BTB domain-containing protein n=1 Tax=Ascobolus immersus RN42 TaxID=1160509 RepID=A0A3N4HT60_ASCIM|nr:hypothetical protein BJ508DRAFT_10821 [Ascobolus immersus RN42]
MKKADLRRHIISECSTEEGKTATERTSEKHPVKPSNVFAEDGDLILSVTDISGTKRTSFLVYSRFLVSASPVFAKMLSYTSPFAEGRKLRDWNYGLAPVVLELDDKPDCLWNMLLILFHRNSEVPEMVSLEMLADMAVVIDKYGIRSTVLQLWAEKWKKHLAPKISEAGSPSLLMIGWAFGFEDYFKAATHTICRHFVLNDQSQFEWQDKSNATRVCLMEETPETVIKRMKELVNKVRKDFQENVDQEEARRFHHIGSCCTVAEAPEFPNSRRICDSFQIGLFLEYRQNKLKIGAGRQGENSGGLNANPRDDSHLLSLEEEYLTLRSPQGVQSLTLYASTVANTIDRAYGGNLKTKPTPGQCHNKCFWFNDIYSKFEKSVQAIGLELAAFPSRSLV